jgi:outer membrane protein assembly factor BamB
MRDRRVHLMVIAGSMCAWALPAAYATSTTISLSRSVGPPTSAVTVSGAGFGSAERVIVTFDLAPLVRTITVGGGKFKVRAKVPSWARPGPHTLVATGDPSGLSAEATFTVRTDWVTYHFDQANTGFNPYENVLNASNVVGLQEVWSQSTAGPVYEPPVVWAGTVYVAADQIVAFDTRNGDIRWYSSYGYGFKAALVWKGIVYAGSLDEYVYAFDATNGSLLWSAATEGAVQSPLALSGGIIYAGTTADRLYALDAETGSVIWKANLPGPMFFSAPAVVDGVVYVTTEEGSIEALDATTGVMVWRVHTPGGRGLSTPVVSNGFLYVAAQNVIMVALNALTGRKVWSVPGSGGAIPAVSDGVVYGDDAGYTVALNADTGNELWQTLVSGSPVIANGLLYEGTGNVFPELGLVVLNATTGELLTSVPTSSEWNATPVVADGMVFMGDENAVFHAYALP